MKKFVIPVAALTALATLAAGRAANAQVATILKPVQIGVAAGAAVPVSDLGNSFNIGFNVTGTIGINVPLLPVGFRIDAAYNQIYELPSGYRRGAVLEFLGPGPRVRV